MKPGEAVRIRNRARRWRTVKASKVKEAPQTLAELYAVADREHIARDVAELRLKRTVGEHENALARAFRDRHREGEHMKGYWRTVVLEWIGIVRLGRALRKELEG